MNEIIILDRGKFKSILRFYCGESYMNFFSESYFSWKQNLILTQAVLAVFAKNRGIFREKCNTFTVTVYRFFLKSVPLPIPFTASSKNLYRNTVPQKFSIPLPLPLPQKRYTAERYSVLPYLCRPLVKTSYAPSPTWFIFGGSKT